MYIIIHIFLFYYALVLLLSTLLKSVHTYQLVLTWYTSLFTYQCQTTSPDKRFLFYHGYFMREKEYIYIFLNQKEQNIKKAN